MKVKICSDKFSNNAHVEYAYGIQITPLNSIKSASPVCLLL